MVKKGLVRDTVKRSGVMIENMVEKGSRGMKTSPSHCTYWMDGRLKGKRKGRLWIEELRRVLWLETQRISMPLVPKHYYYFTCNSHTCSCTCTLIHFSLEKTLHLSHFKFKHNSNSHTHKERKKKKTPWNAWCILPWMNKRSIWGMHSDLERLDFTPSGFNHDCPLLRILEPSTLVPYQTILQ